MQSAPSIASSDKSVSPTRRLLLISNAHIEVKKRRLTPYKEPEKQLTINRCSDLTTGALLINQFMPARPTQANARIMHSLAHVDSLYFFEKDLRLIQRQTAQLLHRPLPPLTRQQPLNHLRRMAVAYNSRRRSSDNGIWRHIFGDNGTRGDDSTSSDLNPFEHHGLTSNPDIMTNLSRPYRGRIVKALDNMGKRVSTYPIHGMAGAIMTNQHTISNRAKTANAADIPLLAFTANIGHSTHFKMRVTHRDIAQNNAPLKHQLCTHAQCLQGR